MNRSATGEARTRKARLRSRAQVTASLAELRQHIAKDPGAVLENPDLP
jgi:hypothetical protein